MKHFLRILTAASMSTVITIAVLFPVTSSADNWYDGPFIIINYGTQMCMSTENSYATWTYIVQYDCNGNNQYQRFIYTDSGVLDQFGEMTYTLRPYHEPTQCVSIESMSTDNGAPARLYPCFQAGTNQFFSRFWWGTYRFALRALSSNKYLQPTGGTATPGARITQWQWSVEFPHELWSNSQF